MDYTFTAAWRPWTAGNCQDTHNRHLIVIFLCEILLHLILLKKIPPKDAGFVWMQSTSGDCASWTLLFVRLAICAFTVITSEVMRAPSGYDMKQKSLTQRTDTSKAYKEWKQNKAKKTMNWQMDSDRELRKAEGIRSHNMGFPTANSQSERFN